MIKKLLFLVGLAVAAVVVLFLYVNRQVTQRLNSLDQPVIPAVYSAPLNLSELYERDLKDTPGTARTEVLHRQLVARRYVEVTTAPKTPGEFRIHAPIVDVYVREFTGPDGSVHKATSVSVNVNNGKLIRRGESDADAAPVLLEPQVISYFGSDELRASRFTPLKDIPLYVQRAVIATEDERFFKHFGIDLMGIGRAMYRNVRAGKLVEGGSTLTQQLAKNVLFTPQRTLSRKALEMCAAISLELHLPKERILELYLNEVYLGQEGPVAIHGFPEAASAFFGKKVSDLTIAEAATLAGIIRAPSYNSPRRHGDRAKDRRDVVLGKMLELGFITASEAAVAKKQTIRIAEEMANRRLAPHFTTALEKELSDKFDVSSSSLLGVSVYTGLDLTMQSCAESAVSKNLAALEKAYPKLTKKSKPVEVGLVAIEPHSGLVKAWIGGRDFSTNQFNHVHQGIRQIGSTIKPFLYLTALDKTLNTYKVATTTSILDDRPVTIDMKRQGFWSPENYDHEFHGDVTLRYALEHSLNMPALYVSQRVGLSAIKTTTERFGISNKIEAVPALALGTVDASLLNLTAAYAALANGGIYVKPRLFIAANDRAGTQLASSDIEETPVVDDGSVFVLTNILQGVVDRGTAAVIRKMGFAAPAAGKTGTSNEARDAWFVGFVPSLATGVWVGFDDNSPVGLTGGRASAPIWADFMKCAQEVIPENDFLPPRSVVFLDVDGATGELATKNCPREQVIREVYVRGTEPIEICHEHGGESRRESEPYQEDPQDRPRKERDRGFWESLFGD